jgi:hypothetical protein
MPKPWQAAKAREDAGFSPPDVSLAPHVAQNQRGLTVIEKSRGVYINSPALVDCRSVT